MSDTDRQNVDPFAAAFARIYASGAMIDVPAGVTAHDREARRAAHVKDRQAPGRSREDALAALAVEREKAAAFVAAADRKLAPAPGASSLSAQVDEILADEDAVDFGVDEEDWDGQA